MNESEWLKSLNVEQDKRRQVEHETNQLRAELEEARRENLRLHGRLDDEIEKLDIARADNEALRGRLDKLAELKNHKHAPCCIACQVAQELASPPTEPRGEAPCPCPPGGCALKGAGRGTLPRTVSSPSERAGDGGADSRISYRPSDRRDLERAQSYQAERRASPGASDVQSHPG